MGPDGQAGWAADRDRACGGGPDSCGPRSRARPGLGEGSRGASSARGLAVFGHRPAWAQPRAVAIQLSPEKTGGAEREREREPRAGHERPGGAAEPHSGRVRVRARAWRFPSGNPGVALLSAKEAVAVAPVTRLHAEGLSEAAGARPGRRRRRVTGVHEAFGFPAQSKHTRASRGASRRGGSEVTLKASHSGVTGGGLRVDELRTFPLTVPRRPGCPMEASFHLSVGK